MIKTIPVLKNEVYKGYKAFIEAFDHCGGVKEHQETVYVTWGRYRITGTLIIFVRYKSYIL